MEVGEVYKCVWDTSCFVINGNVKKSIIIKHNSIFLLLKVEFLEFYPYCKITFLFENKTFHLNCWTNTQSPESVFYSKFEKVL